MARNQPTRWIEEADARRVCDEAMYDRMIAVPCRVKIPASVRLARVALVIFTCLLALSKRRIAS